MALSDAAVKSKESNVFLLVGTVMVTLARTSTSQMITEVREMQGSWMRFVKMSTDNASYQLTQPLFTQN